MPKIMAKYNKQYDSFFDFYLELGEVIRILQEGEGFGEKALLENRTRTLTAVINKGNEPLILLSKAAS
jgi:hypothetical protein